MESCYIPNNPQYGLSLEYTSYNPGYQVNDNQVNEGVLCCSGLLPNCGHCHLQCDEGLNADLDNGLDDFSSKLANYDNIVGGDQLVDYERLRDCHEHLKECESQCDSQLEDCDNRLRECEGGLECGNSLGGCGVDQEGATEGDQGNPSGNCWTSDDMGSFSLPSLDLDPLPSLFPFSPCSVGYK